LVNCFGYSPPLIGFRSCIGRNPHDFYPRLLKLGHCFFYFSGISARYGNPVSGKAKLLCKGEADAGCATGDETNFIFQMTGWF
jgi:hypothetical protein